jgi:hypothetical protein
MKRFCMSDIDERQPKVPLVFKLILVSILLSPSTAYAYVDPGTGSVIVSSILGLIAAIGYTFRKYFYKLKRKIFGSKPEGDQEHID